MKYRSTDLLYFICIIRWKKIFTIAFSINNSQKLAAKNKLKIEVVSKCTVKFRNKTFLSHDEDKYTRLIRKLIKKFKKSSFFNVCYRRSGYFRKHYHITCKFLLVQMLIIIMKSQL